MGGFNVDTRERERDMGGMRYLRLGVFFRKIVLEISNLFICVLFPFAITCAICQSISMLIMKFIHKLDQTIR